MTFQPAVNCAEIVINATSGGKPIANVMNCLFNAPYSQSDLDAVSDAVDQAVVDDYIPFMATTVNYLNTTVRGLTSIVDLISINADNAGPGTRSGDPRPNNCTMCFRLSTGFTGRSARGRFYAFPLTDNDVTAPNVASATYAAGIIEFLESVRDLLPGFDASLVILSRQNGGVVLPAGVPRFVTTIDYHDLNLDSQRGRLPR